MILVWSSEGFHMVILYNSFDGILLVLVAILWRSSEVPLLVGREYPSTSIMTASGRTFGTFPDAYFMLHLLGIDLP